MQIFVICLNPLLHVLKEKLPGIRVGRRANKTAVVTYADDVTIFVIIPEDIPIIGDAIWCYENASEAYLNIRETKAMAGGTWNTTINIMDIPYYTDIRILDFSIARILEQSACKPGHGSRAEHEARLAKHTAEICAYPKILIHTCLHPGEIMVHCNIPPVSWRMCATAELSDILVLMSGRNIRAPPLNTTSVEGTRGMGSNRQEPESLVVHG
jgi:hypothetical protein